MPPRTICFGFDGICCDMSFFIPELPKYKSELCIKYPFLKPILELLLAERPEDCELQLESTGFGFETFFDCIYSLSEISSQKTTHIGANTAIETVTAINLLKDPAYPIDFTKVYFLGNYNSDIFRKLPKDQRIDSVYLEYANYVKTSYIPISIIIPYREKRGIISFGGIPSIRRIESLRPYLKKLSSIIQKLNPDLMALLGMTNVFATTEDFNDFKLVDPFLELRYSLIDLGGTISWEYNRLEQFYQMVEKAKIVIGNDEEFRSWYNFKYGESITAHDPLTLYKMTNKLRKKDQILVCHTKSYQFVLGLESTDEETVKDCMNFANKATVIKTDLNTFPTAKEVQEVSLQENTIPLPELLVANAIVTRSIDKKIINPVGLGDIWSCTFILGLLSQNLL
ncbi:MAG: hypothetical protein ACTSYB_09175 [Candidatus Helarchaeota archaeon]